MKKLLIILLPTLFVLLRNGAAAQDFEYKSTYRVTAYKNGEPQVNSRSNEVETIQYFNLFIPNTFTPNGDGLNESFGPVGEGVEKFSMLIFNRWGEMIYETHDINKPWDGTHEGRKVQIDTYVYKIFAVGKQMGVINKTGKITLLI